MDTTDTLATLNALKLVTCQADLPCQHWELLLSSCLPSYHSSLLSLTEVLPLVGGVRSLDVVSILYFRDDSTSSLFLTPPQPLSQGEISTVTQSAARMYLLVCYLHCKWYIASFPGARYGEKSSSPCTERQAPGNEAKDRQPVPGEASLHMKSSGMVDL